MLAPEAPGARRAPLPRTLEPMLPSLGLRPFSHPDWLFEPKLDGYRVLATRCHDQVRLASRRGRDCTAEYPWLVEALLRQPCSVAVFDGEIVALDEHGRPSFQHLQNRAVEPCPVLVYYAFDLLYHDGYDLRGVRLDQRKALLQSSLVPSERVRIVDAFLRDGEAIYRAVQSNGMEGIVAKRRDSRYESGRRSDAWLKIKATLVDEFVVGGYTLGSGARASTFGSLVVGYYANGDSKLTYVGHAGSGFDNRTLASVFERLQALKTDTSPFNGEVPSVTRWPRNGKTAAQNAITWVKPELVAQVKYTERTQDGVLRGPVFLGLRDDKLPAEVSIEATPAPSAELSAVIDQLEQHTEDTLTIEVDGHAISLSNLNKVLWPAQAAQRAITKRDLIVYYARVGPYLLPHLRDRPLTLVRAPNGITGQHFYQKHWEQPRPAFVETVWLYTDHHKGDGEYLLANNLPSLLWLGQIANLELHTWYSRINPAADAVGRPTTFAGSPETMEQSVLNYPDFIVFDLDPYLYAGTEARGEEPALHPDGFHATCEVALWLKEALDGLGLASFVKTTGRTGLHVYVPIVRSLDYHATHAISQALARFLVQQHPRQVTAEWAVDKRRGKVFVDYNQNVRGKTLASIYSPRMLPWAAVSMPLRWDEVSSGVFPTDFTILSAPERLARVGDVWSGILTAKHDLAGVLD